MDSIVSSIKNDEIEHQIHPHLNEDEQQDTSDEPLNKKT